MAGGGPEKNPAVWGSFDRTRRFEALFRSACEEGSGTGEGRPWRFLGRPALKKLPDEDDEGAACPRWRRNGHAFMFFMPVHVHAVIAYAHACYGLHCYSHDFQIDA